MTEREFFHWLSDVLVRMVVLMLVRILLLMRPISLFAGLMSLQVGLFSKLSSWSFRVMKACCSAMRSTLSCMLRSVAMIRASLLMMLMVLPSAFS